MAWSDLVAVAGTAAVVSVVAGGWGAPIEANAGTRNTANAIKCRRVITAPGPLRTESEPETFRRRIVTMVGAQDAAPDSESRLSSAARGVRGGVAAHAGGADGAGAPSGGVQRLAGAALAGGRTRETPARA